MSNWKYFNKFESVNDKFLPFSGEGDNMATQICTAVNKLIYKWYNDGDVYDNTGFMKGWCNDLSSYANWLLKYADADILCDIGDCRTDNDYEKILMSLADIWLDGKYLEEMSKKSKQGTIYDCDGPFEFNERYDDCEYDDCE